MNKTPLNHFILYCKGWYVKTNNVFDDLIKILELDDYTPFDKTDVLSIVVNRYEQDFDREKNMLTFLSDIHKDNCWKVGYYWKEKNVEYDYFTAILYKIMSDYRFKQTQLSAPRYSKTNPRPDCISLQKVIEVFNRKPELVCDK